MRGLLNDVTTRFGSPADYLRAHGFADDEIAELRRVLLRPL
jgi:protein-tyrosine phosphatase